VIVRPRERISSNKIAIRASGYLIGTRFAEMLAKFIYFPNCFVERAS
jgi:hypothetical protein